MRRMLQNVRACLFDFDGTLVHQEVDFALMRQRVLDVVARYGVPVDEYARMYVLEMIERVAERLRQGDGSSGATSATAKAAVLAADFATEAHRAIVEVELVAAERAEVFPGVPEMLRRLKAQGIGIAIVTRNCREAVLQVMARYDLPYDVLLTRDDVPFVKPDPRHLLAALEALNVTAEGAVMCGDHPMDVMAGQSVQARTVGVLPPGQSTDYFAVAPPDLIVSQITDILEHLDSPTSWD